MSDTPPSSTSSRSGTPLPRSPSRLVIPPVSRHAPSIPSRQPHGTASASQSPHIQPATGLESSASSVVNLDISDGILVHDVDAEVETMTSEEITAVGQVDDIAGEESRKSLRDHLRRTLSKKEHAGISHAFLDIFASQHAQIPTRRNLWLLSSPRSKPPSVCHSNLLPILFRPDIWCFSRWSARTIQTKRVFCVDRRRKTCLHWVCRTVPKYEVLAFSFSMQC